MATVHEQCRPRKLGNFEILQEIGQRGMGVIYLARQPALDRRIVLKKIRRELLVDSGTIERFQREARTAAQVHHQNVVAVYDCFDVRGDHYIAQEFVEGPDLGVILGHIGRLGARDAAVIALEIVRGLEEVHARGIVHRDLKPANILIGCNGETKIADFGSALGGSPAGSIRPGTLVGSIPYISPEQMLGRQVDYRSDLFSVGIMLYEMLVGEPPFMAFEDDTTATLVERIENEAYDPPRERVDGIPRYLAQLIRDCLRADPAHRTQTAMQIRRRLERRLGRLSPAGCRQEIIQRLRACDVFSEPDSHTASRYPPSERRSSRFRRFGWAIPAAVALVTIGVGVIRESGRPTSNVRLLPPPDRPSAAGATPALLSAAAAPEQARLRVAAYPWAEVRLEDGTRFHTPRAAPLEITAGRHTIVFEHPRYGTAEVVVDIDAGENRLVHHVFDGAPRP